MFPSSLRLPNNVTVKRSEDDNVSLYLKVNGNKKYGSAWSGEGDGRRGTGAFSVVIDLNKNDVVEVFVQSDGNPKRHVAAYTLAGFSL